MTSAIAVLVAATITGTAPEFKAGRWCFEADSTRPSRVAAVVLYAVGQRAPAWRPGCEKIAACWDSVRAQAAERQVASVGISGGVRFTFDVPPDTLSYFVRSRWQIGGPGTAWLESGCWGRIVRP